MAAAQEPPPPDLQREWALYNSAMRSGDWTHDLLTRCEESLNRLSIDDFNRYGRSLLASNVLSLLQSGLRFRRMPSHPRESLNVFEDEAQALKRISQYLQYALIRLHSEPLALSSDDASGKALNALLTSSPFFDTYIKLDERVFLENRPGLDINDKYWFCPLQLNICLAWIADCSGFDGIARLLEGEDQGRVRIPIPLAAPLCSVFLTVLHRLGPESTKRFGSMLLTAIRAYLERLKDDELKGQDKAFIDRLFSSHWFSLRKHLLEQKVSQLLPPFTELRMRFISRLLKVPSIQLRLAALTDLLDVLRYASPTRESKPSESEDDLLRLRNELLALLLESNLLTFLYKEGSHPELLRRTGPLLAFLASADQLTEDALDMIWSCSEGQHETIVHAMWAGLADCCSSLPFAGLSHLFQRVVAVPSNLQSEHFVALLQAILESSLAASQATDFPGFRWLWQAATSPSSPMPAQLVTRLGDVLLTLMLSTPCRPHRLVFLERLLQLLDGGDFSFPRSLSFIRQLIESHHAEAGGTAGVITYLVEHHDLLNRLIQLLHRQPPNAASFFQQILDFIQFMLSSSEIPISNDQIDRLWDAAVLHAKSEANRDIGFRFFETVRNVVGYRESFSIEQLEYVFNEKLPTLDLRLLTSKGFLLFDFYFRYLNWHKKKFEQVGNEFTILAPDLLGLDLLWKIAFAVRDKGVGELAVRFLTRLQKNWAPKLSSLVKGERTKFLQRIIAAIQQASQTALDPKVATAERDSALLTVERCLDLISFSLEILEDASQRSKPSHHKSLADSSSGKLLKLKFKVIHSSETLDLDLPESFSIDDVRNALSDRQPLLRNMRIIAAGKELKEGTLQENRLSDGSILHLVARVTGTSPPQEDSLRLELSPSRILSTSNNLDLFFNQLSLPSSIALRFWDLIERLPTSSSHYERIIGLSDPAVLSLFDTSNVFKLFYALQIVNSLLKKDEIPDWPTRFASLGGLRHLLHILISGESSFTLGGERWPECRALLLSVLAILLFGNSNSDEVPTLSTASIAFIRDIAGSVVQSLFGLLTTFAASSGAHAASPSDIIAEDASFGVAIRLLASLLLSMPGLFESSHISQMLTWLDGVLLHSFSSRIRLSCALCLVQFSNANPAFHAKLLFEVRNRLPNVVALTSLRFMSQYSSEYWSLFKTLLESNPSPEADSFYTELFHELSAAVEAHPIVEATTESSTDALMFGLLSLLETLVRRAPSLGIDDLVQLGSVVFSQCLFETPKLATRSSLSGLFPPKCKTPQLRGAAFAILQAVVQKHPRLLIEVSRLFIPLLEMLDWKTSWVFKPEVADRDPHMYAGLKNLGATCYMNSLLQQLFMLPGLRSDLLAVSPPSSELQNNILYQIQCLFANLQETSKKWHDARSLAAIYKVDGQPIRVSEQMDADEFFRGILDKLESDLKGTPHAKLLDRFFRGAITYQTISKECEHTSERDEPFYNLAVEIKDKSTLQESLEALVQADMLDGDNKYHCDRCNKKVAALRRATLGDLPPVLVVHLKRFEFDLETMGRKKLNSHLEFPMELDFEPYTKQGLSRRDRSDSSVSRIPADYKLTGIVVHTGSVDSGHYYSFIQDPRSTQWYQFNDRHVSHFDPNQIPEECFGGVASGYYDHVRRQHVARPILRPNNAYMLFYQRLAPTLESSPPSVGQRANIAIPLLTEIWQNNEKFARERLVYEKECLSFLARFPQTLSTLESEDPQLLEAPYRAAVLSLFKVVAHSAERPAITDALTALTRLSAPVVVEQLLDIFTRPNLDPLVAYLTGTPEPSFSAHVVEHLIAVTLRTLESSALADLPPLWHLDGNSLVELLLKRPEWPHLRPVLRFISLIALAVSDLREETTGISSLLDLVKRLLASSLPLARYYARSHLLAQLLNRIPIEEKKKKEESLLRNKFGAFIECLALLASSELPVADRERLFQEGPIYHLLRNEVAIPLVSQVMIQYAQEPLLGSRIISAMNYGLNKDNAEAFKPYFETMHALLTARPELTDELLRGFLSVIDKNRQYPVATSAALQQLNRLVSLPLVARYLKAHQSVWLPFLLYRSTGPADRVRYPTEALVRQLTHCTTARNPLVEGTRTYGNFEPAPVSEQESPRLWISKLFALWQHHSSSALCPIEDRKERPEVEEAPWTLRSFWRLLRWLLVEAPSNADLFVEQVDELLNVALRSDAEGDYGYLSLVQLLEVLSEEGALHERLVSMSDRVLSLPRTLDAYSPQRSFNSQLFPCLLHLWSNLAFSKSFSVAFVEHIDAMRVFDLFTASYSHLCQLFGSPAAVRTVDEQLRVLYLRVAPHAPMAASNLVASFIQVFEWPSQDEFACMRLLETLKTLLVTAENWETFARKGLDLFLRGARIACRSAARPIYFQVLATAAQHCPKGSVHANLSPLLELVSSESEAIDLVTAFHCFESLSSLIPEAEKFFDALAAGELLVSGELASITHKSAYPVAPFFEWVVALDDPAQTHRPLLRVLCLLCVAQGGQTTTRVLPSIRLLLSKPESLGVLSQIALLVAAHSPELDSHISAILHPHRNALDPAVWRPLLIRTLDSSVLSGDGPLCVAALRALVWLFGAPTVPAPTIAALDRLLGPTEGGLLKSLQPE